MQSSAATSVVEPARYLGQFLRTLENSRLALPLEWRGKKFPKKFALILWPVTNPTHLLVLPPDRWVELQLKFRGTELANEETEALERIFSMQTRERSLDSWGRLALHEEAVSTLGVRDSVLLVGLVNRFEIWHPDKFNEEKKALDVEKLKTTIKTLRI